MIKEPETTKIEETPARLVNRKLVSSISNATHIKNKGSELRVERSSVNNSVIGIEEEKEFSQKQDKTIDIQLAVEEISEEKEHHEFHELKEEPEIIENKYNSEYYKELLKTKWVWPKTHLQCAIALMREKKWDEALIYVKKTQVIDPDYEKGKVHECIADIFFNHKNEQWETVQDLYDKALSKYDDELQSKLDDNVPDEIERIRANIWLICIKKGKCYEK